MNTRQLVFALFVGTFAISLAHSKEPDRGRTQLPDTAPVVQLTVKEYIEAVGKSATAEAVMKYRDSILEISGQVSAFTIDRGDSRSVQLYMRDEEDSLSRVTCQFWNQQPWKSLNLGDKVTIRGQIHDRENYKSIGVFDWLDYCNIVKTSGAAMPEGTATQLAKSYMKDPAAFFKRHSGNAVIISGTVESIPDPAELTHLPGVLLKNEGGIAIEVVPHSSQSARALKPGQKVELMGSVDKDLYVNDPERKLQLGWGQVISVKE